MTDRPDMSKLRPNKNDAIISVAIEAVNARIDNFVDAIIDRVDDADRRHAELAELVRELTVAVETLERKVDRLEGWTEGFSATIADAAAVNSLESKADWKGLAYVLAGKDQPDEGDTSNASDTGEGVS